MDDFTSCLKSVHVHQSCHRTSFEDLNWRLEDRMTRLRSLFLSAVLCTHISSVSSRLYASESTLVKNAVLSDTEKGDLQEDSLPDEGAFLFLPGDALSSVESRQKRMFFRNKYHLQTQQRGKLYQNSTKTDRWSKFTLSLDVPTTLMNILFNIAKTKNLQAKADENARLMARIGKRK
ncbi:hypothetical protein COCON_G00230770 [Conger conger]|uniref:Corticotropin-releasing factor domain-containing protein n=1 Tax=Conger conger TaxID=82655 RepID=A0A9Q1CV69_CONCO|nr:hypothetical protein COCON_G00230770 [Conger conger]